jgi:nucleoside-diphosphate-sugar epimerase
MNILVTGSSGQLGSEIVRQLAVLGSPHRLVSIDINPGSTTHWNMSVNHREQIFEITRNIDVIIHTASLHGKHVDLNCPKLDFVRTNIEGTLNLLEAAVANRVRKFIYTSTTSIYGKSMADKDRAVWVTEELTPQPRDIYDITKLAAENLCRDFAERNQLPVFVLRIARFYREDPNLLANYRLYRGLDVRDGAAAHILAVDSKEPGFHILNISSASPFQESELAELRNNPAAVITRYFPEAVEIYKYKHWQFPDTIDRVYVIEKARQILGYCPRYNYKEFISS